MRARRQSRPRSIQFWLRLLVIACILPATAVSAFLLVRSYDQQRANREAQNVGTARALTQAIDAELSGATAVLQVLAMSPRIAAGDFAAFHALALRAVATTSGTNVSLSDANGQQIVNTLKPYGASVPPLGNPTLHRRALETGKPVVSDVFLGGVTQQPFVAIAVPVLINGRIDYTLAMGFSPERLGEILLRQKMPADWVAAIFDGTGTVAARTKSPDQFVGKPGSASLRRQMVGIPEGSVDSVTLEGIPVHTAFSRSSLSGWSVVIGVPSGSLTGDLRRSLWLSAAGAGAVLLLGVWFAQRIARRVTGPIAALAGQARALGSGSAITAPPVDIIEVDALRTALLEAAALLAQRARERDVAEQSERRMTVAAEAADAANRAKSLFLSSMSHEIRTPMNGVICFAGFLLDSELDAQQRRYATLLKEAGQSLLAIINDILDVSKIEAGKLELEQIPVSFASVADGVVSILQPQASAKGLDLRLDLAQGLPSWIVGDPTRLRQILLNLTNNAVKFTERGRVTIRVLREAGPEGDGIRFEVRDTGIGISADKQDRLFLPFSQIDNSTSRHYGGTGLGLVICKRLVEAMGGRIGVTSQTGVGSTFWFVIPLLLAEAPAAAPPEAKSHPATAARILVAEDVYMNQIIVDSLLQAEGHDVVLVSNGEEAVQAVQASDFDLVLMDMQMPVMDGVEATRAIRRLDARVRGIPIIALTANAMSEEISACLAAGMNAHLSKPIDQGALVRIVGEWVGRGMA